MFTGMRISSLALLLGVLGCGEAPVQRQVILITLDTTRADLLAAGSERTRLAPNLDRFLRESVAYPRARTVAPLTLPAHASMLTGLYPPRHRVRGNGPMVLTPSATTVAERARDAGYETAAFIGSLALDRGYGLAQGFEVYDQPERDSGRQVGGISERSAATVISSCLRWLLSRGDERPFFLWIHLFDPHAPYDAAEPFLAQAGGDPYRAQVAEMDHELAKLLDVLRESGELARSFVVVVGDHGESLGEHSEDRHGLLCYDSTLRVPLFLRYPDLYRSGETSSELVSVVDVQPTLLEALGLEQELGVDGLSLFRRRVSSERGVYFESYEGWRMHGWAPLGGWIDSHGKYIHSSRPELYDLRRDAGELENLFTQGSDVRSYLEAIEDLLGRVSLRAGVSVSLEEERRAELEKLGYTASEHVAEEFPSPLAPTRRPSPSQRAGEARRLEATLELMYAERWDEAIGELSGLIERNPFSILAHERLIRCRMATRDWERALESLQARQALPPESIATHRDLATCLRELGRDAQAQVHVRRSLELLIEWSELRGETEKAKGYREILRGSPRADSGAGLGPSDG